MDLRQRGIRDARIPELVERFWPVVANEIRQGIFDSEGTLSAEDIATLTREYRALLKG